MPLTATAVPLADILPLREAFRREMAGQIVHDSLPGRTGWTQAYLITDDGYPAGYGFIAMGGPWRNTRTVFEFYVTPEHRGWAVEAFAVFQQASGATHFEFQTSNLLLTALAHAWNPHLRSERIVYRDQETTALPAHGARLRAATPADAAAIFKHHREPVGDWLLEFDGAIIATGGWLSHYNPPYVDLYMQVAEPHRRRGYGAYLVQELKRLAREAGKTPCARCSMDNRASQRTLEKAGFAPCSQILAGPIRPAARTR